MKVCKFCGQKALYVGVHDDEGNYRGDLNCSYLSDPWSGITYGLHHKGWGDCILCTADDESVMGGILFNDLEEANEWMDKIEK